MPIKRDIHGIPTLVGFVGVKGSGKDSAGDGLAKFDFRLVALADPLRKVVQLMFHLEDEHMSGELKEKPGPLGGVIPPRDAESGHRPHPGPAQKGPA